MNPSPEHTHTHIFLQSTLIFSTLARLNSMDVTDNHESLLLKYELINGHKKLLQFYKNQFYMLKIHNLPVIHDIYNPYKHTTSTSTNRQVLITCIMTGTYNRIHINYSTRRAFNKRWQKQYWEQCRSQMINLHVFFIPILWNFLWLYIKYTQNVS